MVVAPALAIVYGVFHLQEKITTLHSCGKDSWDVSTWQPHHGWAAIVLVRVVSTLPHHSVHLCMETIPPEQFRDLFMSCLVVKAPHMYPCHRHCCSALQVSCFVGLCLGLCPMWWCCGFTACQCSSSPGTHFSLSPMWLYQHVQIIEVCCVFFLKFIKLLVSLWCQLNSSFYLHKLQCLLRKKATETTLFTHTNISSSHRQKK